MAMKRGGRPAASRIADSHDLIRVHGARENNLKDLSMDIPKRQLTVFTGVSGSGKTSLVFDTIAAGRCAETTGPNRVARARGPAGDQDVWALVRRARPLGGERNGGR